MFENTETKWEQEGLLSKTNVLSICLGRDVEIASGKFCRNHHHSELVIRPTIRGLVLLARIIQVQLLINSGKKRALPKVSPFRTPCIFPATDIDAIKTLELATRRFPPIKPYEYIESRQLLRRTSIVHYHAG